MMTETSLYREIEYYTWKIHKEQQHLKFLDNCKKEDILPKFCQISQPTYKRLHLKPQNSLKIQNNIFNSEYQKHTLNLASYQNYLNYYFQISLRTNPNANKTFSILKSRVEISESSNDKIRNLKFEKLLKTKTNKISPPTILIHNLTDIVIPEKIENILLQGIHQPVGGRTNRNLILTKFEDFFESWRTHAEKYNLDVFKITQVRSELYLEFCKLVKCTTKNDSDELRKFLDFQSELLICPSDKSKNINLIDKKTYLKKLDDVFSPDKFKPLKINPINTDLQKVRKLINNFKPFLTNLEEFKMHPIETLKRGYGIIKNHKINLPLRPIVSSLDTITSGVENYLKELIAPINQNCKFSVDSTLSFKTKIFEFSQTKKFNSELHEVVSFDCQSLYTSINLKKTLKCILDTIYSDPVKFFPPRTKTVKILKEVISKQVEVPPRKTLEDFFMAILT